MTGTAEHRGSGDPTRIRLLQAGCELLRAKEVNGITEVKLIEACKRSQLTTGAAYALWKSQVDYQKELAYYLVSTLEQAGPDVIADEIALILSESGDIETFLRRAAPAYLDRFIANEDFYLALRFWSSPTSGELSEAITDSYRAAHKTFAELFIGVLDHYQYRITEPHTIDTITTTVFALTEGHALNHRFNITPPKELAVGYSEAFIALLHHTTTSE